MHFTGNQYKTNLSKNTDSVVWSFVTLLRAPAQIQNSKQ